MCGISHYGFNTTIPGGFLVGPSVVTWGVYIYVSQGDFRLMSFTYLFMYFYINTPTNRHFKAFLVSKFNSKTSFLSQLFKENSYFIVTEPCKVICKSIFYDFHYYLYLFVSLFMHLYTFISTF